MPPLQIPFPPLAVSVSAAVFAVVVASVVVAAAVFAVVVASVVVAAAVVLVHVVVVVVAEYALQYDACQTPKVKLR